MGFYYFSIFSVIPLGIAYIVFGLLFWSLFPPTRGWRRRKLILAVAGVVCLLAPISEELWIAWNYGRACEKAGTFIHKTVVVEGFYIEDGGAPLDLVQSSGYRFIESKTRDGMARLLKGDDALMKIAFDKYRSANSGKDPETQDIVQIMVDENTEALVFPKRNQIWRIEKIKKPSAQYKFRDKSHIRQSHKLVKHEATIVNAQSNEILGEEIRFGRYAPWFFVSLGAPIMLCYGRREVKGMLYENVLIPKNDKKYLETK